MKKTLITFMCLINLVQADNITSIHSSYYNHQVNSNNIDNSTWLSNNNFSFFSNIKNDYKTYMGGESLIYINGNYDMDSYMNRKELVLQLGIYESIYIIAGRGLYNQKSGIDEYDAEETGYIEGASVNGNYSVYGLSYHFLLPLNNLLAIEWYESKFDKVSNSEYISEYSWETSYEKNSIKTSELDNSTFMLRFGHYLKGGHTGVTIGMGIDNSGMIMSFGVTLRYF